MEGLPPALALGFSLSRLGPSCWKAGVIRGTEEGSTLNNPTPSVLLRTPLCQGNMERLGLFLSPGND